VANLAEVESNPRHAFLKADIADHAVLRAAFAQHRPSAVYHLAAETHVDRSIAQPAPFVATNLAGTATLLDAALQYWRGLDVASRDAFRFLQVSTDEVYGALGATGHFTEDSPYRPSSPYAASKAGADHLARAWHRTYGFPILVSNCSNNYGPYQFPEKLVPLTILHAIAGKSIPVYAKGENVRDWLHVDDHVAALTRIVAAGRVGETYLIGARAEARNIDMVRKLCGILDAKHPQGAPHERLIEFVADRPGHDERYAIDPAKIEREIGWRAAIDLDRGLAATVEWYMANAAWSRRGIAPERGAA